MIGRFLPIYAATPARRGEVASNPDHLGIIPDRNATRHYLPQQRIWPVGEFGMQFRRASHCTVVQVGTFDFPAAFVPFLS